ncbi:MAG: hypothetical protein DMF85_00260 [Acidobacteria bacterium]|nr:MAG: hypothetical protein DMF85_00260 [Acidobacteriota bacterium]
MRSRDLSALANREHDLLIIGGGVYGLAIAADAASRGLRVALVEAADFGSGVSFNHQKTAHGGLRSLSTGHLGRARQSIRERRALARIAPRLLRPLPFIVGTYRSLVKSRLALRAGFKLDGWLARHRNDGIEPELHLPPARLVSRAATLKLFPGISRDGLTGGAMWYDYQIVEADRLTLAFAESADAHGADVANYAEATAALREAGRIAGMRVRDRLSGEECDVRAALTINAAGARAGEIMRGFGVNRPMRLLKAMNLVTRKPASDIALAAPDATGRMLTLVPWRGRALVGTSQSSTFREPGDTRVLRSEVEAFVADANAAFPALQLTMDDVTPLDHTTDGASGAMTVVGVKFTTARGVAARVVSRAARRIGKRVPPSRTDRQPMPGAGIADHEALAIETARAVHLELAPPTIRHLIGVYGERCVPIIKLMAEQSAWRAPLTAGLPNVGAEVVYAIRHEMAHTLADVVIRRTGLGSGSHPGSAVVQAAAGIAGDALGWTPSRAAQEIAEIDRFYEIDEE